MRHIHLREPKIPKVSLCFDQRLQDWQLTDDPKQVTCGRCQRMMERREKHKTLVVAASDSLDPTRADYQCDGVNDHVEIQAALDALG